MPQADLMFSVGDYTTHYQQAIVAFDAPVEAEWPIDELNATLAAYYQSTLVLPWLHIVRDVRGPVGYLLAPRNQRHTKEHIQDLFWSCLSAAEMADFDGRAFLVDQPCWNSQEPVEGLDPVAALGYVSPYGPALPVGPINDGIRLLMGQQDWPETGAIYLYPVRKANESLYSGLWLADMVDGLNEDDLVDDAVFKSIREQNLRKGIPTTFQRKRYDW